MDICVLVIINEAAMNESVQTPLQNLAFDAFANTCRNGIAG
jgi:hypothetical protein